MADGTKAGWTPGPWRVAGKKSGYIVYAGNDPEIGSVQIANVGNYRDTELLPFSKKRWDADCALISAAPDLYEALEQRETDIGVLIAQIRALEELLGETLDAEDTAIVLQIERDGRAQAALARARGDAQ